jgi:hypothetical protein
MVEINNKTSKEEDTEEEIVVVHLKEVEEDTSKEEECNNTNRIWDNQVNSNNNPDTLINISNHKCNKIK